MRSLAIAAFVIATMASCTKKENSEAITDTIENIETMEKQEKQKIEALLRNMKSH
ncbi:MAG: hypothetical protein OEV74_02620 [Cyclobacteriaceae bacterium]|nr:hypothetical protein [Cyclobacteriaceae bacterium]MDH4295147.1 hypothetical protein [Cyclobacteriaceae bacterium]MDH5249409.1 hypothetical protein [Cyclobacteriaceae bacterium]